MEKCSIEECEIFDFMADVVGMSVLHPGGFKAAAQVADLCHIDKAARILDVACGKGTSAFSLGKRYGCAVVGLDICEAYVTLANKVARKQRMENKIVFQVGDAANLPFSDGEFDAAIVQALLPLVDDKERVLGEAVIVTKPGGYLGLVEPSWQKQPPKELFDEAISKVHARCFQNISTFEELVDLATRAGLKELKVVKHAGMMGPSTFREMMTTEGLMNTMRIMFKWVSNSRIRKRMNLIRDFFRKNKLDSAP